MKRNALRSLIDCWYLEYIGERKVPIDTNGAYGLTCRAFDKGDPMALSSVIELEQLIVSVEDEAAQAAVILRLAGWRPEQIGGVLRDKRPGRRLLEDAMDVMERVSRGESDG